jgi:glyoxylase-like metal-dependent hydrolase (beta-lactamase superfamily II)
MGLSFGQFELHAISGGRFRMDGGCMFGVVPKTLWQKKASPDEQNRILMETNCLLIRSPDTTILVDTGYGTKGTDRDREIYELESGNPLVEHLAQVGIAPEQITHVVLSHLHFDHAGGCTWIDPAGELQPTFPRARHILHQYEWEDATGRLPELKGAYFERDFVPLESAGLVERVGDGTQVTPGVTLHRTGGHTRGHQVVLIESQDQKAIYFADLCPTASHLRTFWTMSYDQSILEVRRIRPKWVGRAADEGWLAILAHDSKSRAGRIRRDDKEEFVLSETVEI